MKTMKPVKLFSCLRAVHQRGQILNLLTGLLFLIKWVLVLFMALFAIDWLIHIFMPGRVISLGLLISTALYRGWRNGWQYFRLLSFSHSALKVENHYNDLKSLLVTGVQLYTHKVPSGTSASMAELSIKRADEVVEKIQASAVVPYKKLHKPALISVLLCALICVMAYINTPVLMAGIARIFTPWRAVTYPTRTYIELADKDISVKEGDPVQIRAHLKGEIPASARLSLRTGKGKPRKRKLEVVDATCEYNMAAAFRSFDYSIRAGDADSDWHTVNVISSPRVAKTRIYLVYPEYMQKEPETMEAMTLAVSEGTSIEWKLQLDTPVSSATFKIEGGEPLSLELSDDGLTLQHKIEASASGAYSFAWVEKKHNFSFSSAKHYLQVTPDQPPQIEISSPSKNLFATVGRKLQIAYRGRDDHGIGEANIIYRQNNAAEKEVPFASEMSEGRSVQQIDWDYREALKNLNVGDSVTFAIEVSDLYPPPDGPHIVRSESRRVSFLSREDYLLKVSQQKERLLAQLRTVYRQERAAYDVIRSLDPVDDAFEQICFLESSRQDILTERIITLNTNIRVLLDDLIANNITDEAEFSGLKKMQTSLEAISRDQISQAALQLRDLGPSVNSDAHDVAKTAETINTAARELGSLVLQLGVNQAMEVFARELHVIAQTQSALRLKTLESQGETSALSARQVQLAKWLNRLLTELSGNRDYSKSPLIIVRLSRMVKDLRNAGIEPSMLRVAELLTIEKRAEAALLQGEIISSIFELECNIRVGSEYEALLNARDIFSSCITDLHRIALENEQLSAEQFKTRQVEIGDQLAGLYRSVRLLIMPFIPASLPYLLDDKPAEIPMAEEMMVSAQGSLQSAIELNKAGKRVLSGSQQKNTADVFVKLNQVIETRLEEITRTARYTGNFGASLEQSTHIRELLASQMRLTEKTEDAEYDETSGVYLAPSQLHLSQEVLKVRNSMERKNRNQSSANKLVAPMLKMMQDASDAMVKAHPALEANKLGDALAHQDIALNTLQKAISFSSHEASGWLGLANLLMTTEGVALPARFMKDIVAEQRDLIGETKRSTPESRKQLLAVQQNLGRAVYDVSMLMEGTGSALDFEQAMIFAGSDMGLSALKLESGEIPAAMRAQAQASESVADLNNQIDTSEQQFYYFVTVLEFLQEMHTDAVVTQGNLNKLHDALEHAEDKNNQIYLKRLRVVQLESKTLGDLLFSATGREDYTRAQQLLIRAVKALEAGQREASLAEMNSAGEKLNQNLLELRELIANIGFIPDVLPMEASPEYNVMLDMVSLLIHQRNLSIRIYKGKADELVDFVSALNEIEDNAAELLQGTLQHAFMVASHKFITEALNHLKSGAPIEAYKKLQHSEIVLRQCILEYALYYIEIKRPHGGKKTKKGKSGIVNMFKMSNKLKAAYDKDWGGVEGEDPKSGRAEWEVLGRRDRAALNENFVRELPLEYREFLKNYYERLTQ